MGLHRGRANDTETNWIRLRETRDARSRVPVMGLLCDSCAMRCRAHDADLCHH